MVRRSFVLLLLPLVLASCAEDNTPTSPSSAAISLTVTPTPVPVRLACATPVPGQPPPANCFLSLDPTVTISETAGVAGRLNSVDVILRDLGTGQEQTRLVLDQAWIVSHAGTDRIDAFGSLAFRPVVSNYPIPYGTSPNLAVVLQVRFTDDKGNVLQPSVQINVVA